MVAKKKKKLTHFDPMVWFLSNGVQDTPLQQFFLSSLYLFDSIFSGIVWIDKLHTCVKGTCFNIKQRTRKNTFSHFSW